MSQPLQQQPAQQPEQQQQQPPQQQPPAQQPEQHRAPVVVHAPDNSGQLAAQFSAFASEMSNTLRGLPEQLVNSLRESSPQHQQPAPQQQQTAQQAQTQQHTQQPPAQQQAQQTAAATMPFRERLQRAWFGYGK